MRKHLNSHNCCCPTAFSLSTLTKFLMALLVPIFWGKWSFWSSCVSLLCSVTSHTSAKHQGSSYLLWALFKSKMSSMMSRWEVFIFKFFFASCQAWKQIHTPKGLSGVLVAISRTNRVKHVTNMCDRSAGSARRVDASATLTLALSPVPFWEKLTSLWELQIQLEWYFTARLHFCRLGYCKLFIPP